MTNRMRTAMARLASRTVARASVTITYTRGEQSVTLQAALGDKLLKLDDGQGGVQMQRTDRDFLVLPAALALGGVAVTPTRGDFVTVTEGAVTKNYKVLPYADEPVYRDRMLGEMWRVHAKLASVGQLVTVPANALQAENGDYLTAENGDYLAAEG